MLLTQELLCLRPTSLNVPCIPRGSCPLQNDTASKDSQLNIGQQTPDGSREQLLGAGTESSRAVEGQDAARAVAILESTSTIEVLLGFNQRHYARSAPAAELVGPLLYANAASKVGCGSDACSLYIALQSAHHHHHRLLLLAGLL